MKTKRKHKSGYDKMKAAGKVAILLTVSPETHGLLSRAAEADMRPITGFVLHAAVRAATATVNGSAAKPAKAKPAKAKPAKAKPAKAKAPASTPGGPMPS